MNLFLPTTLWSINCRFPSKLRHEIFADLSKVSRLANSTAIPIKRPGPESSLVHTCRNGVLEGQEMTWMEWKLSDNLGVQARYPNWAYNTKNSSLCQEQFCPCESNLWLSEGSHTPDGVSQAWTIQGPDKMQMLMQWAWLRAWTFFKTYFYYFFILMFIRHKRYSFKIKCRFFS
jgi:hypothetical protein